MKQQFKKAVAFILSNQTILSSVLLIFVVVGTLFLNSYLALTDFQNNVNQTLRSKAILAENILKIVSEGYVENPNEVAILQEKLDRIKSVDNEIAAIDIFKFDEQQNKYVHVGGIDKELGDEHDFQQQQLQLAENTKKFASMVDESFAYLSNEKGIRYWNVIGSIRDKAAKPLAIVQMKISLAESDKVMEKTIATVYLLSIVAVIIVLLLILNHWRLFTFEIKAKKLEEIDRMKDDFISMASHELKSPLTVISGYSDLLLEMANENSHEVHDLQMKYLSGINSSAQRLQALISDLLDVSRLEQGTLAFDCRPLDINSIIIDMVDEMKVMADQKELEMVNAIEKIPMVMVDPERLKQILVNLISNAIKYTPRGKVEIQSKEDKDWVYITVADSGVGISAENLEKLFSKFYRIRTTETSNISGTGLGLWIAREIAQKMGGALTVESIEGVGSHFILKLKKA